MSPSTQSAIVLGCALGMGLGAAIVIIYRWAFSRRSPEMVVVNVDHVPNDQHIKALQRQVEDLNNILKSERAEHGKYLAKQRIVDAFINNAFYDPKTRTYMLDEATATAIGLTRKNN